MRLRRSLEKITWGLPAERFTEDDWHGLLDGYQQVPRCGGAATAGIGAGTLRVLQNLRLPARAFLSGCAVVAGPARAGHLAWPRSALRAAARRCRRRCGCTPPQWVRCRPRRYWSGPCGSAMRAAAAGDHDDRGGSGAGAHFVCSIGSRRALRAARPARARYGDSCSACGRRLAIILETEIWPNLLRACHAAHVPVVLASARLSATIRAPLSMAGQRTA